MSTDKNCGCTKSLTTTIKKLGDAWSLCIIASLEKKELRFCELERAIPGINPATLSKRLKALEVEKIIMRTPEVVDKISVVYSLSPKGKAFLPVIHALEKFTERSDTKIT